MNRPKIFIDGREGTTGLQIDQRLAGREDLEVLAIHPELRKDTQHRRQLLNAADLVFLCLPDEAARQAVALIDNPNTRVIDASTAHRTAPGWVYGFPELFPKQREQIQSATRLANPGCHATGFLSLVAPLVRLGVLAEDYPVACHSLTGYTGGGKGMIAEYQDPQRSPLLDAPNHYALGLGHKHLPEMHLLSGLSAPPAFVPILADVPQGMAVGVLLHNRLLAGQPAAQDIHQLLSRWYQGDGVVRVLPFQDTPPRLSANALAGRDCLEITVSGHAQQTMLLAQFDNLGKGASGAAVQNMNLMLGLRETRGLQL